MRPTTNHSGKLAVPAVFAAALIFAASVSAQQGRVRPAVQPGGQGQGGPQIDHVEINVFDTTRKQQLPRIMPETTVRLAVGEGLRLRVFGIPNNPNVSPRMPTATWEVISGRGKAYLSRQDEALGTTNLTADRPGVAVLRYNITQPVDARVRTGTLRIEVFDPATEAQGTGSRGTGSHDTVAGAPGPGGVTLFADGDFRGRSETFYSDVPDLRRSGIGHDNASSVRVDPGCSAVLYDSINFTGRSWTVEGPVYSLAGTPVGNDSVSSVRVSCGESRGATLFEAADFKGRSETVYGDISDMRRTAVGNDALSSVRVDPGCRAELFTDGNFGGRRWVVEGPVYRMDGTPVGNDSVSSVRVTCD